MSKSANSGVILMAIACAVVGVLAALGKFNSIMGFPWIFALVCLALGAHSLWRERPRRAPALHAAFLVAGVAVAIGGWVVQVRAVEAHVDQRERQVVAELQGRTVPSLLGLEPLNTDRQTWDEAASLTAKATLVTFWARWCSPCWKEMAELEELYRRHQSQGLRVVALTRYDRPEDEEERRSDFAKAREFLRSREFSYPAAITDNDDIYRAYRVPTPPGLVLVDDRGTVVDYAVGLERARSLMSQATALVGGSAALPVPPAPR